MSSDRRSAERVRVWFEVLRAHPPLEGMASIIELSDEGARLAYDGVPPASKRAIRVSIRTGGGRPVVVEGKVARETEGGFAVAFDKANPLIAALLSNDPSVAGPGPEEPVRSETPAEATSVPSAPVAATRGLSAIREVLATCHGEGRWLTGRVCMPPKRNLLDHLNGDETFLRLRDVQIPGQSEPLPFIALRCDAVNLVLPAPDQERIEPERLGNFISRPLHWLLPEGLIEGRLDVLEKIRVSDFLMRSPTFVALRDCRLNLALPDRTPFPLSEAAVAILNTRRVFGVSDLDASPPAPDDGA